MLSAIIALSAWVAVPSTVSGATTCVGSRSNYFDGYGTVAPNTVGSTAIISTQYPSLCSGASTFSNAWSMITALTATAGWAQTGYIREREYDNGALHSFSQVLRTTSDAPVTKFFAGPAVGSVHSY